VSNAKKRCNDRSSKRYKPWFLENFLGYPVNIGSFYTKMSKIVLAERSKSVVLLLSNDIGCHS